MADKKISDLGAPTGGVASGDKLPLVDVSDTSENAAGSLRADTLGNLVTRGHGLADGIPYISSGVMASDASGLDIARGGTGATDASGARTNLGLAIGTNVQAQGATLTSLEGLSLVEGDILYATAADTLARLPKGTTLQQLRMNAGATAPEWATSTSQVTYDAIVAGSGGDYTTLGAAIAAASAGWRIFVKDGTYSESAISSSLANLTIEGESNNLAIISHGANNVTFSGANCTIRNLGFTGSTATLQVSGAEPHIQRCRFNYSGVPGGLAHVRVTGGKGSLSNNYFTHTTTSTPTASFIEIGGSHMAFDSNHVQANARTTTANTGVLRSGGGKNTITGNTFLGLQNSLNNGFIINGGDDTIAGNTFKDWMDSGFTANARVQLADGSVFTGNNTNGVQFLFTGGRVSFTGNNVGLTNGTNCITVDSEGCTIVGNTITGANGCATGILINNSAADNTVISGNYIHRFTTNSINVSSSSHDNTIITNNNFAQTTTPIADSGTGTIIRHNFNAYAIEEKEFISATNTSGGALAAGDLVVFKSVASGKEVTTTTSGGDNKVYGMSIDAPANNAKGRIQTLGKTTVLKVNGTTDIAIGDFISTYTTAGIGKKASAGETAIAIALEAYTADDSSGVIDALIIPPRII